MTEKDTRKGVSRRSFIKNTVIGAGTIALAGVAAAPTQAAPIPKKWDMDSDVVVIGFGGAGACAALEAARAGASVLLLEKTATPGGSTTLSGGIIYATETKLQRSVGIEDTKEEMFKYLMAGGQGRANPELVRTVVDMSSQNIDWVASMGGIFTAELLAMSGMEAEPEYAAITPPKKRGHRIKGTGGALFKVLSDAVKAEKNIKVMTNTSGLRLITRPAKTDTTVEVLGIKAVNKGKEMNIKAKKAVILTTGGIMASSEAEGWLKDYSPNIAKCVPGGSLSSTGDGYKMGVSCGGALKGLNGGGIIPAVMFPGAKVGGVMYANTWGLPNIYVKANGARFCDEGAIYVLVVEAMFSQGAIPAYCVFDSNTLKKAYEMVAKGIDIKRTIALGIDPDNLDEQVSKGYLWKGETVADLGKAMGMDASALEKTLDTYNQNAENGKDLEFNRTRGLASLKTGPYYGFKVYPGLVCHNGGLSINTNAQVQDSYNQTIPRLYAAGRDSVGIFGTRYPASGCSLSDFLTFGRIAGRTAAAETKWK